MKNECLSAGNDLKVAVWTATFEGGTYEGFYNEYGFYINTKPIVEFTGYDASIWARRVDAISSVRDSGESRVAYPSCFDVSQYYICVSTPKSGKTVEAKVHVFYK